MWVEGGEKEKLKTGKNLGKDERRNGEETVVLGEGRGPYKVFKVQRGNLLKGPLCFLCGGSKNSGKVQGGNRPGREGGKKGKNRKKKA